MDTYKTYEFKNPTNIDNKCFKVNCVFFEKKIDHTGKIECISESCGLNPEIICDDLSSLTNAKNSLTAREIGVFDKITGGYSQHPEYTLECPTCPAFRLFFNIENNLTKISGMTFEFFNFIKERILCSSQFEVEVILLLFKRILRLEDIIERWDVTPIPITLDQLEIMQQASNRVETIKLEFSRLEEEYRTVVKENERLKNENACIQKPKAIKKISEYIEQVFKRIKDTPGECISEQDLLQMLVFIDE